VLLRAGARVPLSPKAFDLLALLVTNRGRVVDKQRILEALWPDTFVEEANLSVQVAAIRKALGEAGDTSLETIAKRGYRFAAPIEPLSASGVEQPVTPGAQVYYQRANQLAYEASQVALARDLYEAVLLEDPLFGPAWARLGRCHRVIGKFSAPGAAAQAAFAAAERAFQRALAIDPSSALTHSLYAQLEVDTGKAHDAMLRLVALIQVRRHEPQLYAGLVPALRFCGLLDASIAAHRKARALDPNVPTGVHHTWWMKGHYEEALRDTFGDIGYMAGLALASAGQTRDAINALRWRERDSGDLKTTWYLASLRALLEDRREESLASLDQAATLQLDGEALYYVARSLAKLGETERFFTAMSRVIDGGFTPFDTICVDPWLDGMRGDPRFDALLVAARAAMGRAAAAFAAARGSQLLSAA
jgi:DNA-binding winged helix-turn-helix (wHTH) protein